MFLSSTTIFTRHFVACALLRPELCRYRTIVTMSDIETRRKIAMDTLSRTESIIASTPGASAESHFITPSAEADDYRNPLPPLERSSCPKYPPTTVTLDGRDSFVCARDIVRARPTARVAVLNLASDERRAGGWLEYLTRTQVCSPSLSRMVIHRRK